MGEMRRLFRLPLQLGAIWWSLPLLGILFASTINPIPPNDYWWTLVMGREIFTSGSVPDQNLFLFTMAKDAPFQNQPWLAQLVLYLFASIDHGLNLLLRNVFLATSIIAILWIGLLRGASSRAVGLLGMAFLTVALPGLAVRTQIFAFVPFAVLLGTIVLVADRKLKFGWLWINLPIMMVWANTHGSFVLAPVLALGVMGSLVAEGILARDYRWKEWGLWTAFGGALCVTPILNPSGWRIYEYVANLVYGSSVASTVTEWASPDLSTPQGALFFLLQVLSLGLVALRRRDIRLHEGFLILVATYLGAEAVRNLLWWAMIWIVVLSGHLRGDEAGNTSQRQGRIHLAVLVGMTAFVLMSQPGLLHLRVVELTTVGLTKGSGEGKGVLDDRSPVELLQRLKRDHPGRVFHDQAIGGLVEWVYSEKEDTQVAFVDQRMELIPEAVWAEYFLISNASPGWQAALDSWDIQVAVLHSDQWPLIQALVREDAWTLTAADQVHLVFVRSLNSGQDPAKEP